MESYTSHQARYFAEQIILKRPQSSYDSLASAMSGVKVDFNPHQVDAALFTMQPPLRFGALLADEVGIGKTVEAGLILAQFWAERKRHILLIVPAALRTQWWAAPGGPSGTEEIAFDRHSPPEQSDGAVWLGQHH